MKTSAMPMLKFIEIALVPYCSRQTGKPVRPAILEANLSHQSTVDQAQA